MASFFFALSGRNSSIRYLKIDAVIIVTFRIVLIDCNVLKCNSHTNASCAHRYTAHNVENLLSFLFFKHTLAHTYMYT